MGCYLNFIVGKDFFFLDGNGLFQSVDGILVGFKSGFLVGSSYCNNDSDFVNCQVFYMMMDGYLFGRLVFGYCFSNFVYFIDCYRFVGFKVQMFYWVVVCLFLYCIYKMYNVFIGCIGDLILVSLY